MTEQISDLAIYYISGTGNAASASHWIADEASNAGVRVSVTDIATGSFSMPAGNTTGHLLGFAYPTHGFNAIPAMISFMLRLPPGEGRRAFLLNTRAGLKMGRLYVNGMTGVALLLPAFILILKGYHMVGFRPVDLPSNWIFLHPGVREKVVISIYAHWEKHVRNFARKILHGKRVWRGLYSMPLDLALVPVAMAYYLAGRFFLAKTFVAGTGCDNCGLCIKECPTGSITMVSGRPYWKLTCESCMRCINRCPRRAIQTTHGSAVLFWILTSIVIGATIPFIISLFGINESATWWIIISSIIQLVLLISVVWLFYLLIHMLQRYKLFRLLVEYTSLSRLGFWRRYISPWYRKKRSKVLIKNNAEI